METVVRYWFGFRFRFLVGVRSVDLAIDLSVCRKLCDTLSSTRYSTYRWKRSVNKMILLPCRLSPKNHLSHLAICCHLWQNCTKHATHNRTNRSWRGGQTGRQSETEWERERERGDRKMLLSFVVVNAQWVANCFLLSVGQWHYHPPTPLGYYQPWWECKEQGDKGVSWSTPSGNCRLRE